MPTKTREGYFNIEDRDADVSVSHYGGGRLWLEVVGHMQGDSESGLTPTAWAQITYEDARALAEWILANTSGKP